MGDCCLHDRNPWETPRSEMMAESALVCSAQAVRLSDLQCMLCHPRWHRASAGARSGRTRGATAWPGLIGHRCLPRRPARAAHPCPLVHSDEVRARSPSGASRRARQVGTCHSACADRCAWGPLPCRPWHDRRDDRGPLPGSPGRVEQESRAHALADELHAPRPTVVAADGRRSGRWPARRSPHERSQWPARCGPDARR
jgi:hypothetical protein